VQTAVLSTPEQKYLSQPFKPFKANAGLSQMNWEADLHRRNTVGPTAVCQTAKALSEPHTRFTSQPPKR